MALVGGLHQALGNVLAAFMIAAMWHVAADFFQDHVHIRRCALIDLRHFTPRSFVIPVYRRESQSSSIHFFAQFVGVLPHAFTNKPMSTAELHIQMDLPSDIFIERQQALILRL
jgi:hypothetical protein